MVDSKLYGDSLKGAVCLRSLFNLGFQTDAPEKLYAWELETSLQISHRKDPYRQYLRRTHRHDSTAFSVAHPVVRGTAALSPALHAVPRACSELAEVAVCGKPLQGCRIHDVDASVRTYFIPPPFQAPVHVER
jgi:hypothetical protein